jgi:hypothetical protein
MNLFPRITVARTASLVRERSNLPVQELVTLSSTRDRSAIFAATGGRRVPEDEILNLQHEVRRIATESGYPDSSAGPKRKYAEFDAKTAAFMYESMEISAAEAARTEIWSFLGCVVFPDVVRWRFPGTEAGTTAERFGGSGGVVRNTFSRLWWRAAVLNDRSHQSPFHLIEELGEDELVQIMERPSLSGNPALAVAMGNSLLQAIADDPAGVSRMDLMRELTKRLRRFRSIVSFESLDDVQMNLSINSAASASVHALSGGSSGALETVPEIVESTTLPSAAEDITAELDEQHTSQASWELNYENVGDYLRNFGLDIRNRLEINGNLWAMGDEELSSLMTGLEKKGLVFEYRPDGGSGTGYEPAWLLRDIIGVERPNPVGQG